MVPPSLKPVPPDCAVVTGVPVPPRVYPGFVIAIPPNVVVVPCALPAEDAKLDAPNENPAFVVDPVPWLPKVSVGWEPGIELADPKLDAAVAVVLAWVACVAVPKFTLEFCVGLPKLNDGFA